MEEKPKTFIVSTIIFAIIAVIATIMCVVILPISVNQTIANMSENNSSEAVIVAAPFVAIILVLFIFLSWAAAIVVTPMLIVSLCRNIHSSITWVKIVAIVTDVMFVFDIGVAIFKAIQLFTGN